MITSNKMNDNLLVLPHTWSVFERLNFQMCLLLLRFLKKGQTPSQNEAGNSPAG